MTEVSFLRAIEGTGLFGKTVLLVLLIFSVLSWSVILYKAWHLMIAKVQSVRFLRACRKTSHFFDAYVMASKFQYSPVAAIFRAAYEDVVRLLRGCAPKDTEEEELLSSKYKVSRENLAAIERAMESTTTLEMLSLERYLVVLATTIVVCPFIGLFGTVWGILVSFLEISIQESASLSVVATGVSQALVTTVGGLVCAIPAIIAYNIFTTRIKVLISETDSFAAEILTIVESRFME